jgi:DNA-binding response OmpR family regulator/DNA-binding CsgD family transcriptional regulator
MKTEDRDLILIVDDDGETRAMLATALERSGFATLGAADGQSALTLVDKARPSLVVLDAVMPGLSGFDTCRELKRRPDHAHLPVIFLTGLAETEHVIEGLRAGGVDYVTKPIVLEELTARIRVHLATARMAHSARVALDVAGRSLLATDGRGRLIWRTPQAAELLSSLGLDGVEEGLSPRLAEPIAALTLRPEDLNAPPTRVQAAGRTLEVACLGRTGEEFYFRLNEVIEGKEADILKAALGLTAREAEVLVWIAAGKSNRDISDILNISPRTVNKHLEQVFTKLGVENRAAAASIATRIIAARN